MTIRLCVIIVFLIASLGASGYTELNNRDSIDAALQLYMPDSLATDSLNKTKKKKKNFLATFFRNAFKIDTNYIEPNRYNFTLMTQSDWRYKQIRLRGSDDDGNSQSLYFHPNSQVTIGPSFTYGLFTISWSFDIGSDVTTNNSNIYLSLYAPMFGIDFYYENDVNGYKLTRLSGFSDEIKEASEGLDFPGLSSDMTYINVYYIVNHKRFSYPAAYSKSTVQRRTAGSIIAGYSYSRQLVKFDYEQLPSPFWSDDGELLINDALKVHEVRYINHSISLGYSFNWVLTRNLLLNITAQPSIGYNFTKGEKLTSDKLYKLSNLNFDTMGKLALVWNTNHFFAGGSFTAHTYSYRKSTFSCENTMLSAELYFGVNIWCKKKYRKKPSTHKQ